MCQILLSLQKLQEELNGRTRLSMIAFVGSDLAVEVDTGLWKYDLDSASAHEGQST